MKRRMLSLCVAPALLLCIGAAQVAAETPAEQLSKAEKLHQAGKYSDAQTVLRAIDRDALSDADADRRDKLVDEVRKAINLSKKAADDQADADKALGAGRLDDAEADYQSVLRNPYASDARKDSARAGLKHVAEKRALAAKVDKKPAHRGEALPQTTAAAGGADATKAARAAVAQGDKAAAAGQFKAAVEYYRRAKQLVPTMIEAQEKLRQAQLHVVARGEGARDMVTEIEQRERLLWQKTESTVRQQIEAVYKSVLGSQFEQAQQHLLAAGQTLDGGKRYARPVAQYEKLRRELDSLSRYVADEKQRYESEERAKAIEAAREAAEARRAEIQEARAKQIAQLFDQVQQYRKERRYDEAVEVVSEILALDPTNDRARGLRYDLEVTNALQHQRQTMDDVGRESRAVRNAMDEARIPWHQDIMYPRNWPDITERRKRSQAGQTTEPEINRKVRQRLNEPLTELKLDAFTFENVISHLRELADLNIIVNWGALEAAGIEREAEVSLELKDVKLKKALELILDQVSGGEVKLGMVIDEGVVEISTADALSETTFVRVYDIQDLLIPDPVFRPALGLGLLGLLGGSSSTGGGGFGGGGGGLGGGGLGGGGLGGGGLGGGGLGGGGLGGGGLGGGGLGGGGFGGGAGGTAGGGTDRQELVDDLLDLLRDTINPDTWHENGGDIGAIAELNGSLIVTQTADAHEQMMDLLRQLREAKRMSISVEGRFLTITTNFLEETGVDLDVVLNNGNAGFDQALSNGSPIVDPATGAQVLLPRQLSRVGFIPAIPGGLGTPLTSGTGAPQQPFQQAGLVPGRGSILPQSGNTTPIPIRQNTLSLVEPRTSGIPGSWGDRVADSPGMQIFGSFLDNLQVDFLMRATQADRRATVLEAPRLVIPNAETSFAVISDGATQNFVGGGQAFVASGVAVVQPIVSPQLFGRELSIRGWISADRRYVTLDIRLETSAFIGVTVFEAVSPVANQQGAVGGFSLQLPEIQTTLIDTRVSVPDGGTLLLGGIRRTADIQMEAGVPVLSKIPVLKRAFSNRSQVKDEITTLILLTPKIMIQRELEEEAFPDLISAGEG